MKVIVKDTIIDTSLIKEIIIWGEYYYYKGIFEDNDLDEIAVSIEYFKDRTIKRDRDLIILGYASNSIDKNKELIDEARKIIEFIESHRTRLDYPIFE